MYAFTLTTINFSLRYDAEDVMFFINKNESLWTTLKKVLLKYLPGLISAWEIILCYNVFNTSTYNFICTYW